MTSATSVTSAVQAETWASPLHHQELILLDKAPMGDSSSPRPLPARLQDRLGRDAVEYESFVAVRLPADAAKELMDAADAEGYGWLRETRPPISLPFHSFAPESTARSQDWEGRGLEPEPVPGLFVVQFAFPVLPQWLKDLRHCGVDEVTYYGNRAWLLRAPDLETIRGCDAARYLSWAGPFLTTDRLATDLFEPSGDGPFWLQFAAGSEKQAAEAALPAGVEVLDSFRWGEDGVLSLQVRATAGGLQALAARPSGSLLTISRHAEETPSDERQGQIVAGNRTATAVTSPGYLTWLQNAGLRTAANQQTVCVMDMGYDDGLPTAGTQHPDLPAGARIVDSKSFVTGTAAVPDAFGHGTFVAGIIAGNGAGGTVDGQGFRSGLGIAPDAKLVIAQIRDKTAGSCGYSTQLTTPALGQVLDFCRMTNAGAEKARIANYSHNGNFNYWDNNSILFDKRVIDGYRPSPAETGIQPMTIVVSAGNGGPNESTIQSPATGRNVIAVGSTQSYRPSTQTGGSPLACTGTFSSTPTEEANNVSSVSTFSARGAAFGPGKPSTVLFTRVKPDLVAPGGRAVSTVPYTSPTYVCQNLCRTYWPAPPVGYHSYAQGTSFSAPVVTGTAALLAKWFSDRIPSVMASPPLLKAAMIATADDIGTTDHRPSNSIGWGRVNLQRMTDSTAKFYVNSAAVSTGGAQAWTRTIDDPSKPTFVVLAWSDATPDTLTGVLVGPLVNNLSLSAERSGAALGWRGNNFNEVLLGIEDGFSYPYTFGGSLDDTMNTVEAIFLPPNTFTAGQQVIIRVVGIDVPVGPQAFAVYAYNVRP